MLYILVIVWFIGKMEIIVLDVPEGIRLIVSHLICNIFRNLVICIILLLPTYNNYNYMIGERGGSVVECRTPEREVRGSRPTAAVLCP